MKGTGDRFPLLLYRRAVRRYQRSSLALAVLLLALWFIVSRGLTDWPRPPADAYLLSGGIVSASYWLFTLLGSALAYAQPRQDHLRLQTPIYRLKVSYRRIQATRPVDLARAFPPSSLRPADRVLLAPFFGRTAVGIDLTELPLSRRLLGLFLHRFFFAPDQTGLLLIVEDWMALSQQLGVRVDAWRQARQDRPQRQGPGAGRLLDRG